MNKHKITSKDNEHIKHVKKLLTDNDYRYQHAQYAIEGFRSLDTISKAVEIFVREDAVIPEIDAENVYVISKNVFKYISETQNSQGIIVIVPLKVFGKNAINKDCSYLFLDRLQDPGNMGTIFRTAAAFGLRGVILAAGSVDPFSPKVVRSAAGSIDKLDIIRLDKLDELKKYNLIAADLSGQSISQFKCPESFILAIGNEANGLSEEIKAMAKFIITIPISKNIESLNAAVAAGIILYSITAHIL